MRRLATERFNYDKKRYLCTVDTDGYSLTLKCYSGFTEKGECIEISKELFDAIIKTIRVKLSTSLSDNLLKPGKIHLRTRKELNITFPDSEQFELYKRQLLLGKDVRIIDSDKAEDFIEYLSWNEAKYVRIRAGNEQIFVQDANRLCEIEQDIRDQIASLNNQLEDILDGRYKLM
ncbi:hypothetical protein EBB07_29225 [Paenibacillaceae bacterium]|nr:hypothetical protein EBB07_29225 [Paenibacillaceae bacterium]